MPLGVGYHVAARALAGPGGGVMPVPAYGFLRF
jgi:hypothetical protein